MFKNSWFLICLLINEFPTIQGTYFGISALVITDVRLKEMTSIKMREELIIRGTKKTENEGRKKSWKKEKKRRISSLFYAVK